MGLSHLFSKVTAKNGGNYAAVTSQTRYGARVAPQRCPILHGGKAFLFCPPLEILLQAAPRFSDTRPAHPTDFCLA